MKKTLLALTLCSVSVTHPVLAAQSIEDQLRLMQSQMQALQAQIAELQKQSAQQAQKVEAVTSQTTTGGSSEWSKKTTIGGYGEAIYNNYSNTDEDQADLRRLVLYVGHEFTDRLHFESEIEIEHSVAADDAPGEVAVEQAYLQYDFSENHNGRAGLMLVPLGLINERHEPNVFHGVERPDTERRIIPTTWRELGLGFNGSVLDGLDYQVGLTTSLDAGKYENPINGIRNLRSEGAEAAANDLAFYGALNYRGIPGLLLGAGVFSGDTGQDGKTDPALKGVDARVTLWDVHTEYRHGNFDFRALYARGDWDDTEAVNAAKGIAPASGDAAPEEFWGSYAQAAYHIWRRGDYDLAPFFRYERYDTQEEVAEGFAKNPLNDETVYTYGLNFWLHPQVVLKTDYQNYKEDDDKDRFNLGIGFQY